MRPQNKLASHGKGILAADESIATIAKRFESIKLENTELNRTRYPAHPRVWVSRMRAMFLVQSTVAAFWRGRMDTKQAYFTQLTRSGRTDVGVFASLVFWLLITRACPRIRFRFRTLDSKRKL